jgi:hypothetical protein
MGSEEFLDLNQAIKRIKNKWGFGVKFEFRK